MSGRAGEGRRDVGEGGRDGGNGGDGGCGGIDDHDADRSSAAIAPVLEPRLEWLPERGRPEQLIVLLHGWRGTPEHLRPLAEALRAQFPQAVVLAPAAPHEGDARTGAAADDRVDPKARGRQWYSIADLDPATEFSRGRAGSWYQRLTAARLVLEPWLQAQQRRLGVGPAATAIGGFSQGAMVALETAVASDGLVGRVLAFAGCFAAPPLAAPRSTTVHLFHGGADAVIPAAAGRAAFDALAALDGDATIDIAEGIGHELHAALIDCCLHRLTHHIPLRTWRAALGALPGG